MDNLSALCSHIEIIKQWRDKYNNCVYVYVCYEKKKPTVLLYINVDCVW